MNNKPTSQPSARLAFVTCLGLSLFAIAPAYAARAVSDGCTQQHCMGDEVVVTAPASTGNSSSSSGDPGSISAPPSTAPTPGDIGGPAPSHGNVRAGGGSGGIRGPATANSPLTPIKAGDKTPAQIAEIQLEKDRSSCKMIIVAEAGGKYSCFTNPKPLGECSQTTIARGGRPYSSGCASNTSASWLNGSACGYGTWATTSNTCAADFTK